MMNSSEDLIQPRPHAFDRSPYTFVDHEDGFVVKSEHDVVRVRLYPTHWEVQNSTSSFPIPLYAFSLVMCNVAIRTCDSYHVRWRALTHLDDGDRAKSEARWAYERAMRRAPKLLRLEVYRRLRRLLTRVDPLVLAVHRANAASISEAMSAGGFLDE